MIEECIALEIQAAKKEESQLIMDLFSAIGKAIQQLQGTDCDAHLQAVNALKMTPALLEYGPIENIINFLHFYRNHHTLDEVPKATVRMMELEYATVAERTKALQYHTASLQRPKNSGIQLNIKCLEGILVIPTAVYDKQVGENKRLLNVKKLSNEIIMCKTTEDTAMELDGEGAANFEQLQDLIRKECDRRDCKYAHLEDKCKKLKQQVKNPKKTCQRGAALQITKKPAPRRKTNQIKGTFQHNNGVAQKALPPTTLAQKTDETKKSPGQAGEKTAIPSKKVQTNLHRRHKANQLGIHPITLARKNRQRDNSEKTNRTIWIH